MAITYAIAVDPTASGNDAGNAGFAIENPDVLELSVSAPLSAATHKVTVKATDGVSGEFGYGFFNVVVNPAVTALILNQTNTPDAGDPVDTLVGDLQVTGGTAPYTFALVSGTGDGDNTHYQVDGANIELSASGGSTAGTDAIRVEVTDDKGYTFEQSLTVNVAVAPTTTTTAAATTAPPGPLACGTSNANPTMLITMSWTDADVTKSFLGCTWTNGEQKDVFSTSYSRNTTLPYTGSEGWARVIGGNRFVMGGHASAAGGWEHENEVKIDGARNLVFGSGGLTPTSVGVSSRTPTGSYPFGGPWNPAYTTPGFKLVRNGSAYIQDSQLSGTVTYTDGVTVSWGEGSVWPPEITDLTLNQTNTPETGDPVDTLIGDLQVTGGTAPYTFELKSGTGDGDNTHYQIDGANLELSAGGGSTDPSDSVRIEVVDSKGVRFEKALTVTVDPVPMASPCLPDLGHPSMLVTLSWTGGPATRTFLGCTDWESGQQRVVNATGYNLTYTPTTAVSGVNSAGWNAAGGGDGDLIRFGGTTLLSSFSSRQAGSVRFNGIEGVIGAPADPTFSIFRVDFKSFSGYNGSFNNLVTAGFSPTKTNVGVGVPLDASRKSGSVTDVNGITYSWQPNGW
jgi:hypothetical protein